jgi:hypothetical protein
MDEVGVEMQDVEAISQALDLFEHNRVVGNVVANIRVEAQRFRAAWHQPCRGFRIPARKKRHVVALPDEFLSEVGHHALGAAIELPDPLGP